MYTMNNRVAPLEENRVSDRGDGGNVYFEARDIRKPMFRSILKENSDHRCAGVRYEQRNVPVQLRGSSLNGHNAGIRNCCFVTNFSYPSKALYKPNVRLPGTPHYHNKGGVGVIGSDSGLVGTNPFQFPSSGVATVPRCSPRIIQHTLACHQEGDQWYHSCLPTATEGLYAKPQKKNSAAPLCPSCHHVTVQVLPDAYRNSGNRLMGAEMPSSLPSHQYQKPSLMKNKPTPIRVSQTVCSEYLKCFACTCPSMQGRTVCHHYYALSVICWLAIILTVIIVILATVHHG